MTELHSLRARVAYWDKRISLEVNDPRRQNTLARAAWAELLRRVIQGGVTAYQADAPFLARVMESHFAVAVRHRPATAPASPAPKPSRPRARAARGGRGKSIA